MKEFSSIVAGFNAIHQGLLFRWVDTPVTENAEIERWIDINNSAYFMLLFAQLEAEINRLCTEVIRHKRMQSDWKERRAWDVLGERRVGPGFPFNMRVALLTDMRGPVYTRVLRLYDIRNRIAHGELPAETLDVAEIAKDIQDIAEQLKGVP